MSIDLSPENATPLTDIKVNKLERAEPIFFFERNDGYVIACKNQEAYNLYTRKVNNLSNKVTFKLIGSGKGDIAAQAIRDAQAKYSSGEIDIHKAKEIQNKGVQDELEACRGTLIKPTPGALDKIWV